MGDYAINIKDNLEYLRQVSKPVDLNNDDYLDAIKLLKEKSKGQENLLALASIQVGIPLRLIYIKNTDLGIYDADHDESIVLINPVIKKREGLTRFYENCASCLNYMGLVERPYKIEIEYYDELKNKHNEIVEGFKATLLCHELDHLDGILHIDKSIELYDMVLDDRKLFRKTHKYEIIRKEGEFIPTTNEYIKLSEAKVNYMKITKYPQSCMMVETKNKKILIDPGSIKYDEKYNEAWNKADIILVTHKHGDHFNKAFLESVNIPIYSTSEVSSTYPNIKINVVKEGDIIELDDIKVEVVHAVHGYNPNLKGGKKVLENVGYIIDDKNTRFYTTSDTICFENDYKADIVALPVTAHGLTMSPYEAALFSKELDSKFVLPIHMDNEVYPTDIEYMESVFEKFDINYKVLEIEEEIGF